MSESELRKRNTTSNKNLGERAEVYVEAISASAPEGVKPYLLKAKPFIGKAGQAIEAAIPVAMQLYDKSVEVKKQLEPYHLELLLPSLIGLIMCFFGGSFMTVIAAIEAYRMVGWESSYKCLSSLYEDFTTLKAANEKDDSVDADGDGTADVLQIAPKDLMQRKLLLLLKTVDPKRFQVAIAGLNAGFLAVVATLKLQFAKAITLGNAIGEIIEVPVMRYVLPVMEKLLPEDQKKWAEPVLSYACRSTAVSIAWALTRVISAFHSAMRGGVMCSRNILEYLSITNVYHIDHEKTIIDEIAGYGLAIIGLWFQLSGGFSVPFPLNILLLPVTFAEWFLMYFVSQ